MIIINNNSSQAFTSFFHPSHWQPTQNQVVGKDWENIFFLVLHLKLKTMPFPIRWAAFFFYMIEFKLKVQRFSRGQDELFEIFMMWVICHLVTDLDDTQYYAAISWEGWEEREKWKGKENLRLKEGNMFYVCTLCLILHLMFNTSHACMCVVRLHTLPMTHPKPRPARIQLDSKVWRVQLRGTNAA